MTQAAAGETRKGVFASRWWIVAASFSALLMGSGVINIFATGIFLGPVTQELAISRGDYTFGLFINGVTTALAVILFGWLYDRFGVRRILLPGVFLCAVATWLYSTLSANLFLNYVIFGFAGLVGGAQTPMGYTTIVAQWFDRQRGIALGVATAGVGLGVVLVPQIVLALLAGYGWRVAYEGLAVGVLLLAFVPGVLFIRNPPELMTSSGRADTSHLPGMTAMEAVKTWRFWLLTLTFFVAVMAINGTITNVVALLMDRGVARPQAAAALSSAGVAIVLGRAFAGWCLDRVWGPFVAIAFFGASILGMGLLASGAVGTVAIVGAMLCGAGVGAEIDLMGYMMSRYFGLKAFGKIYGLMFALFNVGTGLGPYLSGVTHDMYGSYAPILTAYMIALAVVCAMLLTLGEYAYKPQEGSRSFK
jgi:MFS family permease